MTDVLDSSAPDDGEDEEEDGRVSSEDEKHVCSN